MCAAHRCTPSILPHSKRRRATMMMMTILHAIHGHNKNVISRWVYVGLRSFRRAFVFSERGGGSLRVFWIAQEVFERGFWWSCNSKDDRVDDMMMSVSEPAYFLQRPEDTVAVAGTDLLLACQVTSINIIFIFTFWIFKIALYHVFLACQVSSMNIIFIFPFCNFKIDLYRGCKHESHLIMVFRWAVTQHQWCLHHVFNMVVNPISFCSPGGRRPGASGPMDSSGSSSSLLPQVLSTWYSNSFPFITTWTWTRQGRESLPGTATVQPHQGLAITNLHPSDQVFSTEEPFHIHSCVSKSVKLTTSSPGYVRLLCVEQGRQCDRSFQYQ